MNHIHSTNTVYINKEQIFKKQSKRCEESPVVSCGHGSLFLSV